MDIEKTMQFLLEQQARFDARQAEMQANQAGFDARQAELQAQFAERQTQFEKHQAQFEEYQARFEKHQADSAERITQRENILLDVAAAQERTNAILETLTERHVELEQSHKKLSEAQQVTQKNLNALSGETTQKLNALIDTLERHIANHQ